MQTYGDPWSEKIVKTLDKMSPTSLFLTVGAYARGGSMSLADCLQMEYQLACSCLNKDSDFAEGEQSWNWWLKNFFNKLSCRCTGSLDW